MPNCFQLTPRGANNPSFMDAIDGHICVHFGVPCDPVRYHAFWYDIIGFRLALGKTFPQIREYLVSNLDKYPNEQADTQHLIDICDFLAGNYSPNAWAEIGRR